ncbi:MAG TPA: PfkB family carbohydrate kinase [Methylomirabilota bacterium]|nr:PfkB family carbohydrate kinase [Methylomirabilota bacterium]
MAELLVAGTVALDDVRTPFGEVTGALGGSATYFAYAASFFTDVRLVAVVGGDFPKEHLELLGDRGVDLAGVQVADGPTFRWAGEYGYDLNDARTLDTRLGVLAQFRPELPERYRRSPFVFLANLDPEIQLDVLRKMERPRLVGLDTMNFWIDGKREALREVLRHVDALLVNDAEARMLAGEPNLVRAARLILGWGPQVVVVKRGEYGALMASEGRFFFVPAYPLESVFDPTGAGDTFAGGFMGVLARAGRADEATLRRAIVYGAVVASFTVEDFSLNRLQRLTHAEIEERYRVVGEMMRLEH